MPICLNRRRKIAVALMLSCFIMLCIAAQMMRGMKPAEHTRGLLLMVWMLAGITGMIAGMVLLLAGKAPHRSVRDLDEIKGQATDSVETQNQNRGDL